ncbi:MAG: hypothetical protein A2355_10605 [Spirochaetes bacterium RIFOXYB1_FULL_32_8]|nr:MAG: hypothetical protein A2355_10605 [Spirochaetes bacterium RIFOXYB1_FULL_32_8]
MSKRDPRELSSDELVNGLVVVAKALARVVSHGSGEVSKEISIHQKELESLRIEVLRRLGTKTKGGA